MRMVQPFGFDIVTAVIALSGLFSTHGSCPAQNDVTWKPWKAGKEIYQLWNVTPNKAGVIKSANPTLTLDAVPYLGLPIYLVSLTSLPTIYCNTLTLHDDEYYHSIWFRDLYNNLIDGYVNEFLHVCVGAPDWVNMSGVYYHLKDSDYLWANLKSWVEAGNTFVEAWYGRLSGDGIITYTSNRSLSVGEPVNVIQNDPELYPANNKQVITGAAIPKLGSIDSYNPPAGWTARTLVQYVHGGVTYNMIGELVHTASGGRIVLVPGFRTGVGPGYEYTSCLEAWWYPIFLFQYPLMKHLGIANYWEE